jgi:hypothetical protein
MSELALPPTGLAPTYTNAGDTRQGCDGVECTFSPPGPFARSSTTGANNRKRERKKGSKNGSRKAIAETGEPSSPPAPFARSSTAGANNRKRERGKGR